MLTVIVETQSLHAAELRTVMRGCGLRKITISCGDGCLVGEGKRDVDEWDAAVEEEELIASFEEEEGISTYSIRYHSE